jgi:hypothetical protein
MVLLFDESVHGEGAGSAASIQRSGVIIPGPIAKRGATDHNDNGIA